MTRDTKMVFVISGAAVVLYLISKATKSTGLGAAPMNRAQALQLFQRYQNNPHASLAQRQQLIDASRVLATDKRTELQRMAASDSTRTAWLAYRHGYVLPGSYLDPITHTIQASPGRAQSIRHFRYGRGASTSPGRGPREIAYNPIGTEIYDAKRGTFIPVMGVTAVPATYPRG